MRKVLPRAQFTSRQPGSKFKDNPSKLKPIQKKFPVGTQMCTELASLSSRIWIFRSFTGRFVIEPDTFIGISPLEKGNLHESAVRKTIGLSPEADMAAGLPSGSAPKPGLIAHGTRIRPKEGTDPVDSIKDIIHFPRIDSSPASPSFPFLRSAQGSCCSRPIEIGLNGLPPQKADRRSKGFPHDTVSKEI